MLQPSVRQKAVTKPLEAFGEQRITGGSSTRQPDEGVDRCDIADTFASIAPITMVLKRSPGQIRFLFLFSYPSGLEESFRRRGGWFGGVGGEAGRAAERREGRRGGVTRFTSTKVQILRERALVAGRRK